jgi:hypothetical protein
MGAYHNVMAKALILFVLAIISLQQVKAVVDLQWGPYPGSLNLPDFYMGQGWDGATATASAEYRLRFAVNEPIHTTGSRGIIDLVNLSNNSLIISLQLNLTTGFVTLNTLFNNAPILTVSCDTDTGLYAIQGYTWTNVSLLVSSNLNGNVTLTYAVNDHICTPSPNVELPTSYLDGVVFTNNTIGLNSAISPSLVSYLSMASSLYNNGNGVEFTLHEVFGLTAHPTNKTDLYGKSTVNLSLVGARFVVPANTSIATEDYAFCLWRRPMLPLTNKMYMPGQFGELSCVDGDDPTRLDLATLNISVWRYAGCCWGSDTVLDGFMINTNDSAFRYIDVIAMRDIKENVSFAYKYDNNNDTQLSNLSWTSINMTQQGKGAPFVISPTMNVTLEGYYTNALTVSVDSFTTLGGLEWFTSLPAIGYYWPMLDIILTKRSCYNIVLPDPNKVECLSYSIDPLVASA